MWLTDYFSVGSRVVKKSLMVAGILRVTKNWFMLSQKAAGGGLNLPDEH